jgi:hypothetical protein
MVSLLRNVHVICWKVLYHFSSPTGKIATAQFAANQVWSTHSKTMSITVFALELFGCCDLADEVFGSVTPRGLEYKSGVPHFGLNVLVKVAQCRLWGRLGSDDLSEE